MHSASWITRVANHVRVYIAPATESRTMSEDADGADAHRETALRYVLTEVHPDRRSAEVVDSARVEGGTLFGVKVAVQGFLSQAKYALVVVDDGGEVVRGTACDRSRLRQRLADARDDGG
jgi:hypothetical protein